MNWEQQEDDFEFDIEFIEDTGNPPQIESVSEFLENLKLQDDDLLPMQECRKKWDVLNKKREADFKKFT